MEQIVTRLAAEYKTSPAYAENIVRLIDEGNTIPFIARYRKELTGAMDDQVLRAFADRLSYLRGLDARRAEILSAVEAQGKLTDELSLAVGRAETLAELEDLYRPFRPKRRTRATIAREKGLESLAATLMAQEQKSGTLHQLAAPYVDEEKGVATAEDALSGASDILAEDMSDNADTRRMLRQLFFRKGRLLSKAVKEEDSVYRLYYDFAEPLSKLQSHRILAVNRGEREGFLKVSVAVDEEEALRALYRAFVKPGSISSGFVVKAAEDAYRRLIFPSVEREIRGELTDQANEQAIRMFALNLEPLLMQPPLKGRVVMGFDPAYRTGCKIAVVDETGKVLATDVVYPTPPHERKKEAAGRLTQLIQTHGVTAVAIGNGTASKESEIFVSELIRDLPGVSYMVVSEAGASVYSASKLGAEEFPDFDVSLRSAVSIARRLQDPLAELVKIDPQAIGVGQYQHDMPQARLSDALNGVVEACVSRVGVDLNTASPSLLSRVAGLSPAIARNIVRYRDENGPFPDRKTLKKVDKLGPKTFVQCAGFLRVPESKNPLDHTAVHPESYEAAQKLLALFGFAPKDVARGGLVGLPQKLSAYGEVAAARDVGVGVPTLRDMTGELLKPGRDPRDELPPPLLRTDVLDLRDLKPGMELWGTVRNVVDFGAFIDIGVHQDGLAHISECADRFIRHPSEALSVGDVVLCRVLSCDAGKKRISLSLKRAPVEKSM